MSAVVTANGVEHSSVDVKIYNIQKDPSTVWHEDPTDLWDTVFDAMGTISQLSFAELYCSFVKNSVSYLIYSGAAL